MTISAEDFTSFANILAEPCCLLSDEGAILASNHAAVRMLGLDQSADVRIQDLLPDEDASKVPRLLQQWARSTSPLPGVLNFVGADGKLTKCNVKGNLLAPRQGNQPALIVVRQSSQSSTTNFASLNKKLAQLNREVVERRAAEAAQRRSEARVRLLLDSTGEAMYGIDTEGRCTFANPACLKLTGLAHVEDLLGKNMHELLHHSHADGSAYPARECPIGIAMNQGQPSHHDDEVFWRSDGTSFPVDYRSYPIWQDGELVGSVISFTDITARRKMERNLRRSEEMLNKAQQIGHFGSWDWDISADSFNWSDEVYRILGLTPQTSKASYDSFMEYVHPNDREAVAAAIKASLAHPKLPYDIEHRLVQLGGTVRHVQQTGEVYCNNEGKPIRMIGALHDITERKRVEEAIRHFNEELEQQVQQRTEELARANNELQASLQALKAAQTQLVESEKMASLGGLVAGIAHEVNTPVGVGVTAVSYLDMQVKKYRNVYDSGQLTRADFESLLKVTQESADIISNNLRRAADLVKSFKQVAVDQSSDEQRSFNLKRYIEDVLKSLKPKLKNTQISVTLNCPEELDIISHPGAYSQIVTNLIMNSLSHGFDEGEQGAIQIDISRQDKMLCMHYSDDGKGIPAEHINHVFDPFFTTKRNQGGSGLGLNVVYNLATQTLGGSLECRSEVGRGAQFEMRAPYVAVKQPEAEMPEIRSA